jgi:hypothetical protein
MEILPSQMTPCALRGHAKNLKVARGNHKKNYRGIT